jgi:HlyD family secretion protein
MTATALLTVEQKQQVLLVNNAVFRFVPPAAPSAEEKSSSSLLGAMLPRAPKSPAKPPRAAVSTSKTQQVWQPGPQGLLPITLTKGVSDGVDTEIVSGPVDVGTVLVTGIGATP